MLLKNVSSSVHDLHENNFSEIKNDLMKPENDHIVTKFFVLTGMDLDRGHISIQNHRPWMNRATSKRKAVTFSGNILLLLTGAAPVND